MNDGNNSANLIQPTVFTQRREDLLNRLLESVKKCQNKFGGRKELATGEDEVVATLCESLEEAFSYGIKQRNPTITVASLFQNVQEIVSGNVGINGSSNDLTFWDFCQRHLTSHEKGRFEKLENISTNIGRGRAFIRAALNENSLQRYILKWLNADDIDQFYSPWSIFMDPEATNLLPSLSAGLNTILFAITIDTKELNENSSTAASRTKEEPIIFAPTPIPVVLQKKKRISPVERPICTVGEISFGESFTEINVEKLEEVKKNLPFEYNRYPNQIHNKTELEFFKNHLSNLSTDDDDDGDGDGENEEDNKFDHKSETNFRTEDEKSETSSQYSKSSSLFSQERSSFTKSTDVTELEDKLREMTDRCSLLETRVAQLSLENRQLIRRLTQNFNDSGIDPSSSTTSNFLINIPQVKLMKSSSRNHGKYYVYEIHITMRHNLEHWMVMRRYREFRELHKSLKSSHPDVGMLEIPPKKRFGNMNPSFVDQRRQQLQYYLISVIEMLPQVEACKTKQELVNKFPFFMQR